MQVIDWKDTSPKWL